MFNINHVFQHKIYIPTENASFAKNDNCYQNTLHNFKINRRYSPWKHLKYRNPLNIMINIIFHYMKKKKNFDVVLF